MSETVHLTVAHTMPWCGPATDKKLIRSIRGSLKAVFSAELDNGGYTATSVNCNLIRRNKGAVFLKVV